MQSLQSIREFWDRDLARWWREPPAAASPDVLRWVAGTFKVGASAALVIATLAGLGPRDHAPFLLLIAAATLGNGALVLAIGHLLPRTYYHVAGLVATIAISATVMLTGADGGGLALPVLYLLVVVHGAFMFSMRGALFQVVATQFACAVALHHIGADLATIVMVGLNALLIAIVAAWLGRVGDATEEDALTRIYNRRGFDRRLDDEIGKLVRPSDRLVLALFDLDHFKRINDIQGHAAGDRVLIECANAWREQIPVRATLHRVGGDEFALLLPGLSLSEGKTVMDLLGALTPEGITISAGVAEWRPGVERSKLFTHADLALYAAKAAGRDRTLVFEDGLQYAFADGGRLRGSSDARVAVGDAGSRVRD